MAKSHKRNFLERSVGFEAAFREILDKGFFQSFNADISSAYDGDFRVSIRAEGHIPDDPRNRRAGIQPFLDMAQTLEMIRARLDQPDSIGTTHICSVKTEPVQRWNRDETKIIGTVGTRTSFELTVATHSRKK